LEGAGLEDACWDCGSPASGFPRSASAGCVSVIEGLNLKAAPPVEDRFDSMRRWAHPLRKAIAVLRDEINTALKGAMKARDERRVSTLRMVNAALKNADLEAQGQGKSTLADDELLGLLQKLIKQRQESVEIYDKAGRKELADRERDEIDIIRAYLPAQMSEAEAKVAIAEVIKATGAQSVKDMGKVMAALKQSYAGKMDFGKASVLVKGLLAG
jgi:uncharacterized protein